MIFSMLNVIFDVLFKITSKSHVYYISETPLLLDLSLIIATILLSITLVTLFLYYRKIKNTYEEYEKARNLVSDIVISVNKDLQKQENRISSVSGRTELLISENQRFSSRLKENENRLIKLESDFTAFSEIEPKLSTQINELDKKVGDIVSVQKKFEEQIKESENLENGVTAQAEAKIEAAIPIKRERALAPLTQTELSVLELLANEDKKTASEIRSVINLTREHTTRLMKKLYEDGYLERNTGKIPFAYSLKDEMRKILRKTEAETQ